MPYNVTVSTGDVADKAGTIQREAADLESRLAALTSAMAELAGTWTGAASTAFQNCYETWKGTAQQTKTVLDEIGASLRNASTQYDETEDALRGQWTQ
jgi:WXG100 family type VII secretion target